MYNIATMIRFEKPDMERMAKAVELAIKNHPPLRTILKYNQNGELVQKYDPQMPVNIPVEKVTPSQLEKLKDTLVVPFEILNSPLFRCRLFETEDHAYLFIDVHHIMIDGTSFKVFLNSMFNAYIGMPLCVR